MRVVIDIDENVFTRLFDNSTEDYGIRNDDIFDMARSIRNGTPLPKGHGRLIDAKVTYRKFYSRCYAGVAEEILNEVPTIIEADKGESEEQNE